MREGETVALKWEYTTEPGDNLKGILWMSYDPPGSYYRFRLAVKLPGGLVVYLPNKPNGESLYQGRITIKDQATLEITNVTLDNIYHCSLLYQENGLDAAVRSKEVRVILTGRYY